MREWAEADRHHAGCVLIWTLGHAQFGAIITAVGGLLSAHPDPGTWRDLVIAV